MDKNIFLDDRKLEESFAASKNDELNLAQFLTNAEQVDEAIQAFSR